MVEINYWAVLAAALGNFALGSLWYSPLFFGKKWMHYMGWSEQDMESKKKGVGKSYALMFIGTLVTTYILAHFVKYTNSVTWLMGMQTGFWIWLGFIAPMAMGSVLWEGKKWGLYFINAGFYLVAMVMMGAILAVWQ